MAVYVDNLLRWGMRHRGKAVRSCHLLADSVEELRGFASRIGLRRHWYQGGRLPHYDLTARWRAAAVIAGAREIGRARAAEIIREWRARCRR